MGKSCGFVNAADISAEAKNLFMDENVGRKRYIWDARISTGSMFYMTVRRRQWLMRERFDDFQMLRSGIRISWRL